MSTANIQAFHDKVGQSPELQARLADVQRQAAEFTAQAISRLATEIGTPFTAEEFLSNAGHSSSELADSALADVAGGTVITSKKVADNGFGNLWGLLGTSYHYTTDDNGSFKSRDNHDIGDSIEVRHVPHRR